MARKRYPDECPVFVVICTGVLPPGTIAEGAPYWHGHEPWIALIADPEQAETENGHRVADLSMQIHGAWITAVPPSGVMPLTPAARAMLALVTP